MNSTLDIFGELRSILHQMQTHPEHIDRVLWILLNAKDEGKSMRRYTMDHLTLLHVGTLELDLLLSWCLDGFEHLVAYCKKNLEWEARKHKELQLLLCGWCWAVVEDAVDRLEMKRKTTPNAVLKFKDGVLYMHSEGKTSKVTSSKNVRLSLEGDLHIWVTTTPKIEDRETWPGLSATWMQRLALSFL